VALDANTAVSRLASAGCGFYGYKIHADQLRRGSADLLDRLETVDQRRVQVHEDHVWGMLLCDSDRLGTVQRTRNRQEAQLRQEHKHRLNKQWIVVHDHDPSVLFERHRDPLSLSVRDAGVRYVRPRQADRKLAEGAKRRS
jgi:hypothetical protein